MIDPMIFPRTRIWLTVWSGRVRGGSGVGAGRPRRARRTMPHDPAVSGARVHQLCGCCLAMRWRRWRWRWRWRWRAHRVMGPLRAVAGCCRASIGGPCLGDCAHGDSLIGWQRPRSCWSEQAADRPDFAAIVRELQVSDDWVAVPRQQHAQRLNQWPGLCRHRARAAGPRQRGGADVRAARWIRVRGARGSPQTGRRPDVLVHVCLCAGARMRGGGAGDDCPQIKAPAQCMAGLAAHFRGQQGER
jgi:hypothetical protein